MPMTRIGIRNQLDLVHIIWENYLYTYSINIEFDFYEKYHDSNIIMLIIRVTGIEVAREKTHSGIFFAPML